MRRKSKPVGDRARAVVYLRASTEEQTLGPEAQRKAIAVWAEAQGVSVVATFADLGISGAAPIEKRPGLLAALASLAELGAGLLVVAKRDRLARDVVTAAVVERMVEKAGARILSADGSDSGDGPDAWLMRTIKDAFAQYELLLIRARTKAGLAIKRARGERVGSVLYGFQLAPCGVALEPNLAEQEAIRLMRAHRAEGLSLLKVGARLEAAGIWTRKGTRWSAQTIAEILERSSAQRQEAA